ncbi:hypothetical protein, partial [Desulfothermus sp.]
MKKIKNVLFIILILLMASPVICFAKMGTGKVSAASKDIDIQIFGSLKTYPMYSTNVDFNDKDTAYDMTLDENGFMGDDDIGVRSEFRLGFKGGGEHWSFLAILESDLTYDKQNTDRGERTNGAEAIERENGMSGNSFGVEKLEFTYDFSSYGVPTTLETGWQTKFLDLKTGGVLYGDDHPYVGLRGKINGISYEILDLFVFDDIGNVGVTDGDALDWNVYTLKLTVPVMGLNFSPFYAYSDNDAMGATVNYFGAEVYGKIGMIVPRAEFVYAVGNKEQLGADKDVDISAYAGFASLEFDISDAIKPYIGGYYMSGDDDANDDEINAYNPITNISRYAPTFGMENAFIYKYIPILGSHLYANDFAILGGKGTGYGGIGKSGSAYNPGMYSLGIGCKGAIEKFSYKTQFQYFWFAETGALEDINGKDIDDAVGWEYDLQLTYHFN